MVYVARRARAAGATRSDRAALQRRQEVFADWTPADGASAIRRVWRSPATASGLLLNGKSMGSVPLPASDAPRVWTVPYEPRVLLAVGRNKGREAARYELSTALFRRPGQLPRRCGNGNRYRAWAGGLRPGDHTSRTAKLAPWFTHIGISWERLLRLRT
jgi:hypothetical protein